MNLDSIKKRIGTYLSSDKSWPIIVDFPTRESMAEFVDYFSVGDNKFFSADRFCGEDGTFKLEEFVTTIGNNEGNTFVVGITAFLKLNGETVVKNTLKSILSKSVAGHIVVATYQCKNYLKFSDPRFSERNQIILADGDPDIAPDVCLINPEIADAFPGSYKGFEKLGTAFEKAGLASVYIATDVAKKNFSRSIFNIAQMSNSYDILCNRDARTKTVPAKFGSAEQWNAALKLMGNNGDWTSAVENAFGSIYNLDDCVAQYASFDDNKKWLYFITLSIFDVKKNSYLKLAAFNSADYREFQKSLYRAILTVDHNDVDFKKLYAERKDILKGFVDALDEIVDYCKVLSVKEENAIHYLTDLTQPEKERVIEWLSSYGQNFTVAELSAVLREVYPDLADYLSAFRFKNGLLDKYFESYKYQKAINKILPSFEVLVDEQSRELSFVDILPARSTIVDKLDLSKAHAYFFDALGVEYLGYIQARCNKYGLSANIMCGRSELPSLTCFNKEFVSTCADKGCPISDIKTLDEIKHHGEDSFDYDKVKIPVYLISELEMIDELLKKIRASIYAGHYEKAVILSDHGASRLAVLHETENLWKMATNGVHSGRCCPKNEIDSKPDFAIEAEDFWVLANYDRFQGSRKANVEVHGGASLEEVTVPVIEITRKPTNIEAFITDESRIVTLAAKEFPVIKIFVGINSSNISIRIGDKFYDAEKTAEEYLYEVKLIDITKKGIYFFDILNGSDALATNIKFEVKKKGMAEVNLFD